MLYKKFNTPNRNPENAVLDKMISDAYENNPGSYEKALELESLLKADNFDKTKLESLIDEWNKKAERSRGLFEGASWKNDNIKGKHGRLIVHYFFEPKSIKFEFVPKPIEN